jgi:hypothetical protein
MKWCKHVGGLGPPFPFCTTCELRAMNTYKVPKKQWKKWNDAARAVFNETYYTILHNPDVMTHPKQKKIPAEHWNTLAWNAAWVAADAAKGAI